MARDGDERDQDERERHGNGPTVARGESRPGDGELGGEQAERWQAEQTDEPDAERGGERRLAGGQTPDLSDVGGTGGVQDLSGRAEGDGFDDAVTQDVQQHRRDGELDAERGAERDQS